MGEIIQAGWGGQGGGSRIRLKKFEIGRVLQWKIQKLKSQIGPAIRATAASPIYYVAFWIFHCRTRPISNFSRQTRDPQFLELFHEVLYLPDDRIRPDLIPLRTRMQPIRHDFCCERPIRSQELVADVHVEHLL